MKVRNRPNKNQEIQEGNAEQKRDYREEDKDNG